MRTLPVLVVATAILLTGCGGENPPRSEQTPTPSAASTLESPGPSGATTSPSRSTSPTEQVSRGRIIDTANSAYGTMLFDKSGQAIYLFDKETTHTPECYGACAAAWPPVLTKARPQGQGAVRDALLGTTRRKDDSLQITYDGHPLYFYVNDDIDEVSCHNVSEFGGLWLVVTPSGEPAA